MVLLLGVIAAAVLVPLEFFVFKNFVNKDTPKSELSQCRDSLTCQNGGTNVISQGICSCICTNGFTGSDCSAGGSDGCTTTDVGTGGSIISNVTLGKAVPRLIVGGNSNFSIPLTGTAVMAKFNSEDLSCIAQNSLVSFNGRSIRRGEATIKIQAVDEQMDLAGRALVARESPSAITVSVDPAPTTLVLDLGSPTATPDSDDTEEDTQTSGLPEATQTSSSPSSTFTVTEDVLDFARVAVLYVLQEEDASGAEQAQSSLQRFFTQAGRDSGVESDAASSVNLGGDNTVDLVSFKINLGKDAVGGKTKRQVDVAEPRSWR